ncbi:MAG: hypothetical protein FWG17_01835 [Desulfovibrionaceae bacterium]|nr:hypothetical protein [Desulfovibrionaceae bacterium]
MRTVKPPATSAIPETVELPTPALPLRLILILSLNLRPILSLSSIPILSPK